MLLPSLLLLDPRSKAPRGSSSCKRGYFCFSSHHSGRIAVVSASATWPASAAAAAVAAGLVGGVAGAGVAAEGGGSEEEHDHGDDHPGHGHHHEGVVAGGLTGAGEGAVLEKEKTGSLTTVKYYAFIYGFSYEMTMNK